MAHRSDRREGKPTDLWNSRLRLDDWLLARGFHSEERKSDFLELARGPRRFSAGETSLNARCFYKKRVFRLQRQQKHGTYFPDVDQGEDSLKWVTARWPRYFSTMR